MSENKKGEIIWERSVCTWEKSVRIAPEKLGVPEGGISFMGYSYATAFNTVTPEKTYLVDFWRVKIIRIELNSRFGVIVFWEMEYPDDLILHTGTAKLRLCSSSHLYAVLIGKWKEIEKETRSLFTPEVGIDEFLDEVANGQFKYLLDSIQSDVMSDSTENFIENEIAMRFDDEAKELNNEMILKSLDFNYKYDKLEKIDWARTDKPIYKIVTATTSSYSIGDIVE